MRNLNISRRYPLWCRSIRLRRKYLRQLVDSVREQTYPNWELCLSDGSGESSPLSRLLDELERSDKRIRVVRNGRALRIAENTNAGMEAATGDFIAFADHDDVLTPHALYQCVKALNENREIRLLYSDEDKMSMDGHKFFQATFQAGLQPGSSLHGELYLPSVCSEKRRGGSGGAVPSGV